MVKTVIEEKPNSGRKLSFNTTHTKSVSQSNLLKNVNFAEVKVDRKVSEASKQECFEVNTEEIMTNSEYRTTLMIKNIPNKYTLNALKEEIDEAMSRKYDLLYLPLDNNVTR